MTTQEVAQQLVHLCRQGKNQEAIQSLYHEDCKTIESMPDPQGKQEFQGMKTILERNQWWEDNHEVHSVKLEDPLVAPTHFAVHFKYDLTSKPMGNQRMDLEEIGIYEVQDGKIVEERFFYPCT